MLKLLTKADAISLLNASFGFLAILFIILDEQRVAVSFIFLALLADGLDGIIARRFGGGKMGESLEAMADMVSLSLAPLFFMFVYAIDLKIENILISLPTILVGLLFISCSTIRLASFHVLKDKHYFIGLPASVSTILLIGLSYFDLPLFSYFVIFLILSILMISSIKFPKPTITMNLTATIFICGKVKDFEVIAATKQSWHGGKPGSPGGVNYNFKFVVKKPSSKLVIDQLWVKNEQLEISQVVIMGAGEAGNFAKGDTVFFKAGKVNVPLTQKLGKKKEEKAKGTPPPIEYEGDALIGYKMGKKRKYKIIEKFEMLKTENRP